MDFPGQPGTIDNIRISVRSKYIIFKNDYLLINVDVKFKKEKYYGDTSVDTVGR